MTLAVGSRVGPYEVLEPLGAGGMGEVYRARDAKLNRDVAIKVLPELFSTDPERLARFRREAQVLASLNHPNIGHIHGFENSSNVHALVLELVEGPTLADRIAEGPIPLDEAIPIAKQIADALECAHEQGIIHRDLKPANVKLRPDGTVKVLDFGLAKALDPVATSSPDAMNSPTLTARGTQLGIIVGTAAYMAPEQARGKAVDRRADIWAFGVVLFEMLTGTRAFEGDDVSITLASVLKDDVEWKALPAELPPSVTRLLRRCLEKDPKRRLSAIADARLELDEAAVYVPDARVAPPVPHAISRVSRIVPWTVGAVGAALGITALVLWAPWRAPVPTTPIRLSSEIGTRGTVSPNIGGSIALSPDGRMLAIVVMNEQGQTQLHVRRTSELGSVPLAGTEDAHAPFFSPDGESIAFFAAGSLKRVAVTGGATMTLCSAPAGRGGAWGNDGTIVFQPSGAPSAVLHRVSESGGAPVAFGKLPDGESSQRWPQILPDNRGVLYSGNIGTTGWDQGNIMVQPLDGGPPKLLWKGGFYARYVPTGHILYLNQGTLFALPFNLDTLTTAGNPSPVVEDVLSTLNTGGAFYSVDADGTLVYVPGEAIDRQAPIHLLDASGKTSLLRAAKAEWYFPRFSPDGRRLAMSIGVAPDTDVFLYEAERDLTKFTFEPGADFAPVWTPSGDRLVFASSRPATTPPNLYWQRSSGTGPVERLTESPNIHIPYSFDPTGRFLAFTERVTSAGRADNDILILPLEGSEATGWKAGKTKPFLDTAFNESAPAFSYDGKWLAYTSNESGNMEVYVQPFPTGDGKWKISNGGGVHPRWSKTKNEIIYLRPGALIRVMVAPYRVHKDSFVNGIAREWSPQSIQPSAVNSPYDLHPDGLRIAMMKPPEGVRQQRDKVIFVFNFFDEVRRRAPRK